MKGPEQGGVGHRKSGTRLEDILTKICGKVSYKEWYRTLHEHVTDYGVRHLSGFGGGNL